MFLNTTLFGFGLGFAATLIWSSFYLVGRVLFGTFSADPFVLSFLRYLLAGIFLLVPLATSRRIGLLCQVVREQWRFLLLLGFFGTFGEGFLVLYSLHFTSAARSSLFANFSPLFTVLLAWPLLQEPVGKRKMAGVLLGLIGMIVAVTSGGGRDLFRASGGTLPGDLLALGSGFFWAIYTVLGRRVTGFPPLVVVTAAIFFGNAMTLLFVLLAKRPFLLPCTIPFWASVIYIGVVSAGIANVLWLSALERVEAGKLGMLGYLSVLLTMGSAVIFLKEEIPFRFLFGAICVCGGIVLTLLSPGKRHAIISSGTDK
ncbi:MAG: DMT family transporter [Candidatus Ratteibacteria bacterium]